MIPVQIAAAVFTLLVIALGVIHWRLELKMRQIRKLERNLSAARRELKSLEMLKTRFLGRIGAVLSEPLKAIESTSDKLGRENPGIPDKVLSDLARLSEDVHSLVRILTVFEQISRYDGTVSEVEDRERFALDEIVSEAAVEMAETAAERMVSVSLNICGSVPVSGNRPQVTEAVSSLLRETLRRSAPNTVLSVELRYAENAELEICWSGNGALDTGEEVLSGTGLARLIASSHGGWVSEDREGENITLILPGSGDRQ